MEKESNNLQVFRLSKQVIEAAGSLEHITKIHNDMHEAGVDYPPFHSYAIEIPVEAVKVFIAKYVLHGETHFNTNGWEHVKSMFFELTYVDRIDIKDAKEHDGFGNRFKVDVTTFFYNAKPLRMTEALLEDEEIFYFFKTLVRRVSKFLIVLLATKNIEKTTKFHKDISKGKTSSATKHRERYAYTTTLTIGKITENYDGSEFTGVSRRPHLRRGHVRTQHYGPRNEMTKKVFIPSVFVNGSEDLKSNRVAYNVSFAA
jgi:hypothetical protein